MQVQPDPLIDLSVRVLPVISGLAGTYLGYWLNQRAQRRTATEAAGKRKVAVRMLLRLEIDDNLSMVDGHRRAIVGSVQDPQGADPDNRPSGPSTKPL